MCERSGVVTAAGVGVGVAARAGLSARTVQAPIVPREAPIAFLLMDPMLMNLFPRSPFLLME